MSHDDVCTSAMWINSKSGYEFFSCGLDGMVRSIFIFTTYFRMNWIEVNLSPKKFKVIWWDVRNLTKRLDTVYADPEKGRCEAEQAIPITVLEYEHSLPTKFLVGTQYGGHGFFKKMCFDLQRWKQ